MQIARRTGSVLGVAAPVCDVDLDRAGDDELQLLGVKLGQQPVVKDLTYTHAHMTGN